jgi:hypothetical protein
MCFSLEAAAAAAVSPIKKHHWLGLKIKFWILIYQI